MDRTTRTRQLNQIPVFALRQLIRRLIQEKEGEMMRRVREVLQRRPRKLTRAIQRYPREQLVKLINACPEIGDEEVHELFEAYRYGSNPSFYIFMFGRAALAADVSGDSLPFRQRLQQAMQLYDEGREEKEPRFQHLVLNDLGVLPGREEIIEGSYRFQKRLDYIDVDQNAVSTYETLYGFFWLNTLAGYAIIHARNRDVLTGLREALETAAEIRLVPLVISKQLKNKLPFLRERALRYSRLHDPDPDEERFRWMSVTDDDPYAKGYRALEEGYPELRSARYREQVTEFKQTSLTIRCTQGALSLAGRLQASEFRAWCLDRMQQIVGVLKRLRTAPPVFQEICLDQAPELDRYPSEQQRDHLRRLVVALLSLRAHEGSGYRALHVSPLVLAADLADLFRLELPVICQECGRDGSITCPICGATSLTVAKQEGGWVLVCPGHSHNRWQQPLPLAGECDQGHPFALDVEALEETLLLLPSDELKLLMALLIRRHLTGKEELDPEQENFYVRGRNLYRYEDRTGLWDPKRGPVTNYFVTQTAGVVKEGGTMAGVVQR